MSETFFCRRDLRRGGFTLIEVVIALAIFVFGALAIIRIFPPALGVIQNSGDRLTAINLNRSTLARFNDQAGLIPDAIYDGPGLNQPSAWRQGLVGATTGSVRRNNALPLQNIQDYDSSALGHFKNIVGEKHTFSGIGLLKTQFPFDVSNGNYIVISREQKLDGVRIKQDGTLNFSDARLQSTNTSFGNRPPTSSNYDATTPPPFGSTIFYVSYKWVENGRVCGVEDEPLVYPDTTTDTKVMQASRGVRILEGEVSVSYKRVIASYNANSSYDPTTVDDPDTPGIIEGIGIDGDRGLIIAPTLSGQAVSLDYVVKDWRWLVYDGTPAISPDGATPVQKGINLATRPLDDTQVPYLYSFFPAPSAAYPFDPDNSIADSDHVSGALLDVNLRGGQVVFDTSTNEGIAPTARVAYRTLDGWAQQLSVAARTYKPVYTGRTSTPEESWRNYYQSGSYLYFKPSEAGKTVQVSYAYGSGSTPVNDTQVSGRILPIEDDTIDDGGLGVPGGFSVGNRVSRLELTDSKGLPLSASNIAIQSVRGVSIQARTAWLDGDHYTQASAVGFRGANN